MTNVHADCMASWRRSQAAHAYMPVLARTCLQNQGGEPEHEVIASIPIAWRPGEVDGCEVEIVRRAGPRRMSPSLLAECLARAAGPFKSAR